MVSIKRIATAMLLVVGLSTSAFADGVQGDPEVKTKFNTAVELDIKLAKGLRLELSPEFRFNEGLDRIHLSGGLTYKTFGCIYWGATYRLVIDREESASSSSNMYYGMSSYESEAFHRFAFDVTYKEKFGRFTPSFRLRYNNFTDDEVSDKEFLRYRAKVGYNIRKCKFDPYVAIEWFQSLAESTLYKTRFAAGVDLKASKVSTLSFNYKFDLYALEYKNANVFSFGYKYKF